MALRLVVRVGVVRQQPAVAAVVGQRGLRMLEVECLLMQSWDAAVSKDDVVERPMGAAGRAAELRPLEEVETPVARLYWQEAEWAAPLEVPVDPVQDHWKHSQVRVIESWLWDLESAWSREWKKAAAAAEMLRPPVEHLVPAEGGAGRCGVEVRHHTESGWVREGDTASPAPGSLGMAAYQAGAAADRSRDTRLGEEAGSQALRVEADTGQKPKEEDSC